MNTELHSAREEKIDDFFAKCVLFFKEIEMKKIISLICLSLIFSIVLSSCSTEKVESVTIDNVEYKTLYLYSFKDAEISGYSGLMPVYPTVDGYVYSTEKLSPGDIIRVWSTFLFYEKPLSTADIITDIITEDRFGTNAVVDKLLETYRVKVEPNGDTYLITCYTVEDYSCSTAHNREDLSAIEKQKIEIVKDRAVIKYD